MLHCYNLIMEVMAAGVNSVPAADLRYDLCHILHSTLCAESILCFCTPARKHHRDDHMVEQVARLQQC